MFRLGKKLDARIKKLEGKVRCLECPHELLDFVEGWFGGLMAACSQCGKVMQRFGTWRESLEAKLEYERQRCKKRCELDVAAVERELAELGKED